MLEKPNRLEANEAPKFIYHGTITPGIEMMEPRSRYKPDENMPACIYASYNPVFAAAQGFPWSSEEGIDVYTDDTGTTVLKVPRKHEARLNQALYLYELPSGNFNLTEEEKTGETYHALEETPVHSVEKFSTVREAVERLGGRVEIV